MSRFRVLIGVTFVLAFGAHPFLAWSEDSGKQTASTNPAAGEFVPGFEHRQLAWEQLDRIVLIENGIYERERTGQTHTKHVSSVQVFLLADGGRQPVTIDPDPLAKPLPEKLDGLDFLARLRERGGLWKEKLLKYNPQVRLDILHFDTRSRARLLLEPIVENKVHHQETLHTPSEELRQQTLAARAADVLEKTRTQSANIHQMQFWYYLANAVLGCSAAVVFGFLILPSIRSRHRTVPPPSDHRHSGNAPPQHGQG